MAQKADTHKRDCDPQHVHVLNEYPDGSRDVHEFGVPTGRATKAADRPFIEPRTGAERKYRRLFNKTRAMNLCQQGDPLRQAGVLFWSANYLRLVAIERDEQPDAGTWRQALRRSSPASTLAEIDAAIEHACTAAPIEHDAGQIGKDLDLRDNRWRAARHPRDILPRNRTNAQLQQFFRDLDASRKRRQRAGKGARPQHLSNVRLAERHGRDRETIARWVADGVIDPVTGELTGKPQPKRGRKPSRNMPQKRPPPYKDTTLSLFNDVSRRTDEVAACSAPAGFTEADLAALAAAVDAGLRSGTATEHPRRREALARLLERAAKSFAPGPAFASGTLGQLDARAPLPLARHSAGINRNSPLTGHLPNVRTDPNTSRATNLHNADPAAGINPQEDIETMTAKPADTTDTPVEPAPTGAPVRSRRDWLVEIQKLNRALVEPDLDDAERIVLEEERAELIAGLRAAFPAQEQAGEPGQSSGPSKVAGATKAAPTPTSAPRRVVYSGHNRSGDHAA